MNLIQRHSKHIKRVDTDYNRTHAWVAQVMRQGQTVIKMFTDGVCGGKAKALAQAKAWLAQMITPLAEFDNQMWRRNIKRRNNKSGIVGVHRMVRSESGVACWIASWTDENGISRSRKFSTRVWGERGAKQKAVELRRTELLRLVALNSGVDGSGNGKSQC